MGSIAGAATEGASENLRMEPDCIACAGGGANGWGGARIGCAAAACGMFDTAPAQDIRAGHTQCVSRMLCCLRVGSSKLAYAMLFAVCYESRELT